MTPTAFLNIVLPIEDNAWLLKILHTHTHTHPHPHTHTHAIYLLHEQWQLFLYNTEATLYLLSIVVSEFKRILITDEPMVLK